MAAAAPGLACPPSSHGYAAAPETSSRREPQPQKEQRRRLPPRRAGRGQRQAEASGEEPPSPLRGAERHGAEGCPAPGSPAGPRPAERGGFAPRCRPHSAPRRRLCQVWGLGPPRARPLRGARAPRHAARPAVTGVLARGRRAGTHVPGSPGEVPLFRGGCEGSRYRRGPAGPGRARTAEAAAAGG